MNPSTTRRQRGFSMISLLFWAAFIGFFGYLAVRALPTINEFLTIQKTINKIAMSPPPTVAEIRADFNRQKDIEYAIVSIDGKDLEITKERDKIVIAFAYDKEVPVVGPVFMLIKYEGRAVGK
jgi:cytochrome oxidase assembly protein ShyY1